MEKQGKRGNFHSALGKKYHFWKMGRGGGEQKYPILLIYTPLKLFAHLLYIFELIVISIIYHFKPTIQVDQFKMAVFLWYLVVSNLYSVHVYNGVHWTSHVLQGTRKNMAIFNWSPCT